LMYSEVDMESHATLSTMDASTSNWVLKKDSTWEKHGWWLKSNDN
jgi:hypothetical protein